MPVPDWAKQKVLAALDALEPVQHGAVIVTAQFNYHGALNSVKVKVSGEDEFRPPGGAVK